MADISVVQVGGFPGAHAFLWETLTENDTALPLICPHRADMSVQVVGSFGGGSTLIEGSNIVTSPAYLTLENQSGDAITGTATYLMAIAANVWVIRPRVATGTSVDVDVYIVIATGRGF